MRRAVRVGLVVLGTAMASMGGAQLIAWDSGIPAGGHVRLWRVHARDGTVPPWPDLRRSSDLWMGSLLVGFGLALAAAGAWRRRRAGAAT